MGAGPFSSLLGAATAPAPAGVISPGSWFGGSSSLIATQQPSSNSGVPQNTSTGVQSSTSSGGILAWAQGKVAGPVFSNPVFLAIAALMLSIIMLGHVAHVQIS